MDACLPFAGNVRRELWDIPIKTACGEMGLCSPFMRLPMCEMNEKNKAVLLTVLKKHGLIK